MKKSRDNEVVLSGWMIGAIYLDDNFSLEGHIVREDGEVYSYHLGYNNSTRKLSPTGSESWLLFGLGETVKFKVDKNKKYDTIMVVLPYYDK
jgi:hypothetical protein